MIFDRIMLPAQGRNEDYKFAQTGRVTLVASVGGSGGSAPTPSWLENVIKIDPESGFLSVQDWHVKGNLVIEGQVNQWLAQQLVVDDARIQVNRKQDGAVADSGLVIYDKDTSAEVSALVYDVNGIWKAGGSRLFTEDYNPKLGGLPAADYATKNWVETSATAYNAARLGGVVAASYLRSDVVDQFKNLHTGYRWTSKVNGIQFGIDGVNGGLGFYDGVNPYSASIFRDTDEFFYVGVRSGQTLNGIVLNKDGWAGFGIKPTERLHIAGNGLFTGNLTAVNAALSGTLGVDGNVTAGGQLSSPAYASGFAGSGWRIDGGAETQLTVDRLTVRQRMDVYELVVNQIRGTNGALWVSDSAKVASVSGNRLTIDTGGDTSFVPFVENDLLRCQRWNGKNIKYYVVRVTAVGSNYIDVTLVNGSSPREAGDHLVRMGNTEDTDRQGALYLTSSDSNAPYMDVLDGVNSASFAGKTKVRIGKLDGITDPDMGALTGYGLYTENGYFKGKITVTGGNAATKADVDAVQVGGRNLYKTSRTAPEQVTVSQYGYLDWGRALSDVGIKEGQTVTFGLSVVDIPAGEAVMVRVDFYRPDQTYESLPYGNEVSGEGRSSITFVVPNLSEFARIRFRVYPVDFTAPYDVKIYNEKLETGNRATDWTPAPEDVDAGIASAETAAKGYADGAAAAAETSAKGYADGAANAAESAAKTFATAEANAALTAAKGHSDTLKNRVENTLGLAALEGINQTLITGGKVRTSLLEVTDIVAAGITAGHVEGLELNFTKGKIGDFEIFKNPAVSSLSTGTANMRTTPYDPTAEGMALYTQGTDKRIVVKVAGANYVDMRQGPYGWGLYGVKDGATVFQLGGTNRIAGITFDDSKLYTANWELRKDGSFYFGAGGEIEGGLITGVIESQNWDGENGSRLNLIDGTLEFGNTIKVDTFSKEIIVKDGATQNTGVRIGDFLLSPTSGGAGALDVDLSGSRTVAPLSGYSLPDTLTYINSSGVIGFNNATVSANLTAGNSYVFQTNINARIARRVLQETRTEPDAPIQVQNSFSPGFISPRITVSLFSGSTKVGEQIFLILEKSGLGGSTSSNMSLNVNIPFVAASSSLRVEIWQRGDVIWKTLTPSSGGGLAELYDVSLEYSQLNTSSRVRIVPSAAINELSAKGFLSLWGPEKYFRIYDRAGVTNFIEARGAQMYISPNGVHRLRVTDTGIEKSNNSGGSWTPL
jgi:hypothetical protein